MLMVSEWWPEWRVEREVARWRLRVERWKRRALRAELRLARNTRWIARTADGRVVSWVDDADWLAERAAQMLALQGTEAAIRERWYASDEEHAERVRWLAATKASIVRNTSVAWVPF